MQFSFCNASNLGVALELDCVMAVQWSFLEVRGVPLSCMQGALGPIAGMGRRQPETSRLRKEFVLYLQFSRKPLTSFE